MASWVVLKRTRRPGAGPDLAFVRDGFSFWAFVFPPLWLLWRRLWLEALAVFAVLLAATALDTVGGMAPAASIVSLLVSVFVGIEGNGLRVAAYERRGWTADAAIDAGSVDEAELRYADEIDEDGDGIPDRYQMTPSPVPAGAAHAQPVGLLLNPGH